MGYVGEMGWKQTHRGAIITINLGKNNTTIHLDQQLACQQPHIQVPNHLRHTRRPIKKHPKTSTRQPRSEPGYHSRGSSTIREGHIQISLKGDHKHEWIKWVKFGLNHKHRMKAKSKLSDAEKPKPCLTIEHEQFHQAYNAIRSIDRAIPPEVASSPLDRRHRPAGSEAHQHVGLSVSPSIHLQVLIA